MSFDAQWTALYRLFYKRGARRAFYISGKAPVSGLSKEESLALAEVGLDRMEHVVALHQRDIGANWYQPRVPATWMALQNLLQLEEDELVARVTASPTFEDRVDDDSDGRSLLAFIQRELDTNVELATGGPWLPDLMRYELYLAGKLMVRPAEVARFEFSVAAIREALIEQAMLPDGEAPLENFALFVMAPDAISEVNIDHDRAEVITGILEGESVQRISQRLPSVEMTDVESIYQECRDLLDELSRDHGV